MTPLPLQFPHLRLEFFYFSSQMAYHHMQRPKRSDQIILLGKTESFKVGKFIPAHCA
ncbi:hypothetical protein ACCUM_0296 [Candidatus Accumulibacter phosphatis]|uniref:Uncharacterized protein n=1 Tax=Candidatus Accumulibacter phosphatis TaxID=327160 RepID=A0A5S4EGT2_9PROT|nr:hypothetical protein ACCUM_0296 [Candidatus Accumulibacter phosphatis]